MSQLECLIILKELGGIATTKQIAAKAQEKFPDLSLHTYIGDRMTKLKNWGYVQLIDPRTRLWQLIDDEPIARMGKVVKHEPE